MATERSATRSAVAVVAALPLVYLASTRVELLRRLDAAALNGFIQLDRPAVHPLAQALAQLCDPLPFVLLTAALVAVALLRRRPRTALAVLLAPGGAAVTTQLLKPALASERASSLLADPDQVAAASWPSGHATAAMSLALAAVLVAPARWRPRTAAAGATFAVAVTFSFVALGWHYPSDVLGGFLVATAWTLVALAALEHAERRRPPGPSATRRQSPRVALAPAAVAVGCGALLAVAALVARPGAALAFARDHTTAVAGASLLAAVALALALGVCALVLRPPRR